jgi:hypothetical protein
MTAIAAQVGMSLPGVWARYHRARPAKRPDRSRTAPIRITPWQKMLAGALNEHDAICVRATVITPPWSEADPRPDHRRPSGCSPSGRSRPGPYRACPGSGWRHVAGGEPSGAGSIRTLRRGLINFWMCDTEAPAPGQAAKGLELSLTALVVAARNMNVDQLSAEQARRLAAILQTSVADLSRQARQLERRAQRS